MADATTTNEWISLIQAAIPFVGGGGAIGLYFYYRKIDADNRKLDREKITDQRAELADERAAHKETREERDRLQERLNEAYKLLYPAGGKVDEHERDH